MVTGIMLAIVVGIWVRPSQPGQPPQPGQPAQPARPGPLRPDPPGTPVVIPKTPGARQPARPKAAPESPRKEAPEGGPGTPGPAPGIAPAGQPESAPPGAEGADPAVPKVAYPHPLITEILYAVPTGDEGDANGDGERDTNGDEFIELVNPHDKAIRLGGYTLSGKAPAGARDYKTLRFTFPPVELKPGEVAVVFNGHGQSWKTPPGDLVHAAAPDPNFSGARVFTMNVESARMGLANKVDHVLLTSPRGEKVHCIRWGQIKVPEGVGLVEEAPDSRGSVARLTPGGPLLPHPLLEGKRFSPGRFPLSRPER